MRIEIKMYKDKKLKNGLRIITADMPHMESVSIGIWLGAGGRYENKSLCGISHLLEHMLFKGTASRSANDLKEAIEGIGGNFNAFTGEEVTCYLVKLPSSHMELGLDVLSDMVLNPTLDPKEIEKEKHVICEEIKMYKDQPGHRVFEMLSETMWPNHALGRPIAGYIESIRRFKRNTLQDYMKKYYTPTNTSIVVSGKMNAKKCVKFVEKTFSKTQGKRKVSYELVRDNNKGSDIKVFTKDNEQTHLAFGFHSTNRSHSLRYPVLLLNVILGGNMSSRLFDRLRENKALCYDISASVKKYKDTGAFVIHAGVDNSKLVEASSEIIYELKDIKKNHVREDELDRAKEYSRGQLLLALEDTVSRMIWLGDRIMLEGKAPSIKEIFNKVNRVSLDDIKKAANLIFTNKNLSFSAIGPIDQLTKTKLRKVLSL